MNKNNHEQQIEFFNPKYIYVLAYCGDAKGYRFVTSIEREGEQEGAMHITHVDIAKMCRPVKMSEEIATEVLSYLLSKGIMGYILKTHQEIRTQFFTSLTIAINNNRRCIESMSKDRGQLMEALRLLDKKCEFCAVARAKRSCPDKESDCQTCAAKCPCADCVDNCNWTWDGGIGHGMDR